MLTVSYRKSQDRERELKLLLDMYKSAPKDNRDKAQVRTAGYPTLRQIDFNLFFCNDVHVHVVQ